MNTKDICSICRDQRGKLSKEFCRDNPKHPTYKERYDVDDGLTYLDCWSFIRMNETKDEYEERMSERFNQKKYHLE